MALSFDATEGGLLNINSNRTVPAPFLTKTYQFVDDPDNDHIVSWGEDGATFVVWRPAEFARDLLPSYFKHNNFSSFIRQLNTYGFRKIAADRWEFANEFFRKGEKHLLSEIHRRKASQQAPRNQSSPTLSLDEQAWSTLSSSHSSPGVINCQHAVVALSDENESLRRDNTLLICELSRLRKMYNDIILFIQQHVRLPSQEAYKFKRIICQPNSAITPALLLEGSPAVRSSRDTTDTSERKDIAVAGVAAKNQSLCISFAFPQQKNHTATACKASKFSFVDGKLREVRTSATSTGVRVVEEEKTPPKLFGVPLQGKKRVHSEVDDVKLGQGETVAIESMHAFKNLKTDLALELRPSSIQAPWLKLCSQRDERVYSS